MEGPDLIIGGRHEWMDRGMEVGRDRWRDGWGGRGLEGRMTKDIYKTVRI